MDLMIPATQNFNSSQALAKSVARTVAVDK
jgi:hypothetical protein